MIDCRGALLCDADGNLFPSEEPAFVASADVTNDFLAALGVSIRFTAEQLRRATTGKNFRTTATELAVQHGVPVVAAVAGAYPGPDSGQECGLTAEELQRWVEEEQRRVTAHLSQVLRPDAEVLDPLASLGERFLLAAVSSSATPRLDACFAATGLDALISAARRYSAEDSLPVPTSKPDPAVYLHACSELGLAPATALAIEDSVPGALSAVAAGIPTVGNLQFVPPAERGEREADLRRAGVVEVVSCWRELDELLP